MTKHRTVFLTQRGLQHQEWALAAAPPELDIAMRREVSRDELLALLAEAEFLITERAGVVDAGMIAAAPKLRLIQRLGIQTWDIDLDAARAAGVPVCYAPIGGCVMVAEHMVMQILALLKRVRESMVVTAAAADWGKAPQRCDEDYFAYNWSGRGGIGALAGATVGIVGFGEIGLELAWRLKNFDCTVLYNKRTQLPAAAEERFGIRYAGEAELAAASDVVCCLLPYPGSELRMNAAFFAQMKPGSIFVHCGSGAVVHEDDLIAALQSNHLAGAALDTYTWEPLRPDDPLLALAREPASNLILTPHVAAGGFTASSRGRAGDYDNIMAVLAGEPLRYRIV